MRHSTGGPRRKPAKPHPDFPLFPHVTGRWAKKIRGRFVFFGPWSDPEGALQRWLDEKDDLLAGRTPRGQREGLVLKDLCNAFLTYKNGQLKSGEIAPITFSEYHDTCKRLIEYFGGGRLVEDLRPQDFGGLKNTLAETFGLVALSNQIQRCRSVFKYGYDSALVDKPFRFGAEFRKPSPKALRRARAAGCKRMFEAAEIHALIAQADAPMAAMVLLGVNCAFKNTDCAELPISALDLEQGFVTWPRPKTGIPRRCPLWPETIQALRVVLAERLNPKSEDDASLLFITRFRRRWSRYKKHKTRDEYVRVDAVALRFRRLLEKVGIHRPNIGFSVLRHVFRTVADEVKDRPAVDLIMGHQNLGDVAVHYVERIDDRRLVAVTRHVHDWLYAEVDPGR